MTEQETYDAYEKTRDHFWAIFRRLWDSGLRGDELRGHPDHIEASTARWTAFDTWAKMFREGR